MDEERTKLREQDEFVILDYIRSSVEILMNLKIEESEIALNDNFSEKLKQMKEDELAAFDSEAELPNNYEKVIQKLEADVRNHISVRNSAN